MIKLSERLKMIAGEVLPGKVMADVGTDHGLLPAYLYQEGICPGVIMTDISPGSLDKARETCEKYLPGREMDFRLGSGIEVLKAGEAATLVIAGMGGLLMSQILGADPLKAKSFERVILQPRSAVGELIKWLYDNQLSVASIKLVREGKYICEILSCQNGIEGGLPVSWQGEPKESIKWAVPEWIAAEKTELATEYLTRKLMREEKILEEIKKGNKQETGTVRQNIEYLRDLLWSQRNNDQI
ncbi:MAG: class I SAM-dependent methyltransferase [Anaerovoracaceae bacterium]